MIQVHDVTTPRLPVSNNGGIIELVLDPSSPGALLPTMSISAF